MALYTASFGRRIVAVALDGAAVAVIVVATVYAVNAIAWQWDTRWLDPFWETPEVVQTLREPAGEPSTVKQDGIERTTQFLRETRVYSDGAVRIYSVVEGTAKLPDGSVVSGRAENPIGESRETWWRRRVTYAVVGLIVFLYYGVFEASTLQATPGKRLLGMRVTDLKGRRLSPLRAWLRQVGKIATVAMSGMGYLPALFTMKSQTVHDIIAGTLVVTGTSEKAASSPSPSA